jgi:hypothetical protein
MSMSTVYQLMRYLRWMLWASFLGYCVHYVMHHSQHTDRFGHLSLTTEMIMFGMPLAAVAIGLFELMFRDWARTEAYRSDVPIDSFRP